MRFGPIGVPELIIFGGFLLGPIIAVLVLLVFAVRAPRRARRLGHSSTRAYLRAVPRTDAERRDAVDLAVTGLVFSLLGMIFAPVVLVGLIPLFYGVRKLGYSVMGLGLVEDGDHSDA